MDTKDLIQRLRQHAEVCGPDDGGPLYSEAADALEAAERLRSIGKQFAAVAFNLVQRPELAQEQRVISVLDDLRKQWDAAIAKEAK